MYAIIEPFVEYAFMQRALLAAVLVSINCATLGVYVVFRRMAFKPAKVDIPPRHHHPLHADRKPPVDILTLRKVRHMMATTPNRQAKYLDLTGLNRKQSGDCL